MEHIEEWSIRPGLETGGTTFPPGTQDPGEGQNCPDRLSQTPKMAKNGQKTRKNVKKHEKTPKIHAFLTFFDVF